MFWLLQLPSNINKGNVTLVLMDAQTSIIGVFHIEGSLQMKGNASNIDTFSMMLTLYLLISSIFTFNVNMGIIA
jgi:hypothetical protein